MDTDVRTVLLRSLSSDSLVFVITETIEAVPGGAWSVL